MPQFFVLILVVSLLLQSACLSASNNHSLPIHTLAKGSFSAISQPEEKVIRSEAKWTAFWEKHSVNRQTARRVPEVDFAKQMVIAVTMGRERTGGYAIEITSVRESGNELLISVQRNKPAANAMKTQVLTAPFHYIAVPKSDLKPKFINDGV